MASPSSTADMISVLSQMMALVPTKLSSKSNYMLWRDQIYPLIDSLDLLNHVIADVQHSTQLQSDVGWKSIDQVLRSFIVATLSEQVRSSVIGLGTAQQVWVFLERAFAEAAIQRQSLPAVTRYMEAHLYHAARKGNIEIIRMYSLELDLSCFLTPTRNTVLHIYIISQYSKLKMSVAQLQLSTNIAREILNTCPSLQVQANDSGETPLHMAARYGHVHIGKLLLEYGNETDYRSEGSVSRVKAMLGMVDTKKETAFHQAVRFKHTDLVQLLVDQDPDFPYRANEANETPLYLAAERGYSELVKIIVQDCQSPAYGGPIGRNALHAAAIRGDRDMAKTMVGNEGFKFLGKEADQQGWTPLHYASYFGHYKIVGDLLDHDRECAYIATIDGNETALHIAVKRDCARVVAMFFSKCPDCFELVDERGRNVLHLAVESNARVVINGLILGNSLGYLIDKKDKNGNTALHLFSASSLMPLSAPLLKRDSRVDKMAFNDQNMNVMDMAPTTTLLRLEIGARDQLHRLGFKPGGRVLATAKNTNIGESGRGLAGEDIGKVYKNKDLLQEARTAHLVVAALIATVTFAAGFTLPGGYISEKGANQGLAVLSKSRAFQAFVVLDSMAMVLSCVAVFLHIFLPMVINRHTRLAMHEFAARLTMEAMIAMVGAFFCGVFAVLDDSLQASGLALLSCVVVVVPQMMQLYFRVFVGMFAGMFTDSCSLVFWTILNFKHYYCNL